MKTNRGFNLLSPVYDLLTRIVFGKSIIESQTWFLNKIPANATVLILGGGTGWLLENISEQNSSCKIWYVEISSGMVEKSRRRNFKNEVQFILGTEVNIPPGLKFDVIITNFYLDLFSDEKLRSISNQIHHYTKSEAIWLVTDFTNRSWWHGMMLKIMYVFFRIVCGIDGRKLPDWVADFNGRGWKETDSKSWYGNFIRSSVWIHGDQPF